MKKYTLLMMGMLALLLSCNSSTTAETEQEAEPTAASHDGHHGHHHTTDDNISNQHMNRRPFEDLVAGLESDGRAEWQKPDVVLDQLGDLTGKTVMDIGAGTGYFSFRLAQRGANVIAADVDDRFQEYIVEQKEKTGLDNIETRKVPYDSPGLSPAEADAVIIVNTYHHINDRAEYFAKVLEGLKPGGRLFVVDYKKEETPHGPPLNHRMSAETVENELREAGFSRMELDRTTLPYQYMVMAHKMP